MSQRLRFEDGQSVDLDEYGHLARADDWKEAVAIRFAALDGIELSPEHWAVITILRQYYADYGVETPMRFLVRQLREDGFASIASSLELYTLFPEGPVRQGSRYGGLPIPVSCI